MARDREKDRQKRNQELEESRHGGLGGWGGWREVFAEGNRTSRLQSRAIRVKTVTLATVPMFYV
jgi:hypothetical protein